ncbi:MAG: alpha/beta hydrolase [Sphingomonadaceae bacterium]|nr:alpha/beta hydrolase [Sphingomonadaceae bacterium]
MTLRRVVRALGLALGALLLVALAAFALLRVPDTDAVAMRAKYGGAPSRFVHLGGQAVHLRDTGPRDAPALVLLHGSNAFLQTWEPWAGRLDKRYRVIRLDLPGHGLTGSSPTRAYTTEDYAALVEQLRARLGIERIAIGGNSMGGGVAPAYTLAHPDRVGALVLVDSVGEPDPRYADAPLIFRIARLPVLRDIGARLTPRSLIADSLPGAYGDRQLATPELVDRYWELLRFPGNRQATIDRFALKPFALTAADLAHVRAPTLILWGEADRLIPLSSGRWLAENIPGARLVTYPGAGHLPQEERADATAAEVARFLNQAALFRAEAGRR